MIDPWRYACTECGSVDLRKRSRKGGYRCNNRSCGAIVHDPIDKKTDEVRT